MTGRTRDEVIEDLNVALLAAGHSMRSASIALGLNHSYLSQFMRKTDYSPDVLPEDVRIALARLLGIDQMILRIGTFTHSTFNHLDTDSGYNRPARVVNHRASDRRTPDMRIDSLYEELGRIKERLDRLEGLSSGRDQQPGAGKKPRPQ
jgi:hypothetical protein